MSKKLVYQTPLKFVWIIYILALSTLHAQDARQDSLRPPSIGYFRAEEDYSYLKHRNSDSIHLVKDAFDPIKFIPLDKKERIWLSLGGQYRPRFEFFDHQFLASSNQSNAYYSHRLALSSSLNITNNFRIFSEFYHGTLSKKEGVLVQDDPLALLQLFIESKIDTRNSFLSFRLGRQEMSYGTSRLIGMREGPNIRLSFDALRFKFVEKSVSIDAFYGKEILPNFDIFRDERNRGMGFWGLYSVFPIKKGNDFIDFYYLGINREQAAYEVGVGKETRHTVGLRMSGKNGLNINYNTELIYQFGTFGDKSISSFALELDYRYILEVQNLNPIIGIKLDYISGHIGRNDNRLNSFNSLFSNPTYFGQSGTIAPANLFDIHPSIKINFSDKFSVEIDWDILWRSSPDDGLYSPSGFLLFQGNNNDYKFIGNEPGLNVSWTINRNTELNGKFSYLIPGKFIKKQNGAPLTYVAVTGSYKF